MTRFRIQYRTRMEQEDPAADPFVEGVVEVEAAGPRSASLIAANLVHGTSEKLRPYPRFMVLVMEELPENST